MEKNFKEHLHHITTFVFDVDGVFTDGKVLITDDGGLLRRMDVKDGYAVKTAVNKGYRMCAITGGRHEGVRTRLRGLGFSHVYLGAHHKAPHLEAFLSETGVAAEHVLYMGDDLPDIPPMQKVGLATCPQDAVTEVKAVCHYVSHRDGGNGCVRDVIEQVLKVRGDWDGDQGARLDRDPGPENEGQGDPKA